MSYIVLLVSASFELMLLFSANGCGSGCSGGCGVNGCSSNPSSGCGTGGESLLYCCNSGQVLS